MNPENLKTGPKPTPYSIFNQWRQGSSLEQPLNLSNKSQLDSLPELRQRSNSMLSFLTEPSRPLRLANAFSQYRCGKTVLNLQQSNIIENNFSIFEVSENQAWLAYGWLTQTCIVLSVRSLKNSDNFIIKEEKFTNSTLYSLIFSPNGKMLMLHLEHDGIKKLVCFDLSEENRAKTSSSFHLPLKAGDYCFIPGEDKLMLNNLKSDLPDTTFLTFFDFKAFPPKAEKEWKITYPLGKTCDLKIAYFDLPGKKNQILTVVFLKNNALIFMFSRAMVPTKDQESIRTSIRVNCSSFFKGQVETVHFLHILQNGKFALVLLGKGDKEILLLVALDLAGTQEIATVYTLKTFDHDIKKNISISKNGEWLFALSAAGFFVWNLLQGGTEIQLPQEFWGKKVQSAVFLSSNWLVLVLDDDQVKILDITHGKLEDQNTDNENLPINPLITACLKNGLPHFYPKKRQFEKTNNDLSKSYNLISQQKQKQKQNKKQKQTQEEKKAAEENLSLMSWAGDAYIADCPTDVESLNFSPNQEWLASWEKNLKFKTTIKIKKTRENSPIEKKVCVDYGTNEDITAAALSNDGNWLAVVTTDFEPEWDIFSKSLEMKNLHVFDLRYGSVVYGTQVLSLKDILSFSLFPTRKLMLTCELDSNQKNQIQLKNWDLQGFMPIDSVQQLHWACPCISDLDVEYRPDAHAAFSANGRWLLFYNDCCLMTFDLICKAYNPKIIITAEQFQKIIIKNDLSDMVDMFFSPDNKFIALTFHSTDENSQDNQKTFIYNLEKLMKDGNLKPLEIINHHLESEIILLENGKWRLALSKFCSS